MKKLTFISCLLLSGCLAGAMAANKKQPIYKDAKAPIEERVNDLVSRMTLEEKVQQLNQYTLGRNNNENNRGEEVKKIPATLGSLIYFDEDANLRNEAQRNHLSHLFGTSMFLESPIGRTGMCRCRPGSTHVRGRLDFFPYD